MREAVGISAFLTTLLPRAFSRAAGKGIAAPARSRAPCPLARARRGPACLEIRAPRGPGALEARPCGLLGPPPPRPPPRRPPSRAPAPARASRSCGQRAGQISIFGSGFRASLRYSGQRVFSGDAKTNSRRPFQKMRTAKAMRKINRRSGRDIRVEGAQQQPVLLGRHRPQRLPATLRRPATTLVVCIFSERESFSSRAHPTLAKAVMPGQPGPEHVTTKSRRARSIQKGSSDRIRPNPLWAPRTGPKTQATFGK